MTTKQIVEHLDMKDEGSYYYRDGLDWEDVHGKVSPSMQSDAFEPIDWYFVEEYPGAWKNLFGLGFWSRGAWIKRDENTLITYYTGGLMARVFDSEANLENEIKAMKSQVDKLRRRG